jgi:DNA repair protein RadC
MFIELCLDTKNQIIKEDTISIGSLNANVVHPREVFKTALAESAAHIIVAHNHPQGSNFPSRGYRDNKETCRDWENNRSMCLTMS